MVLNLGEGILEGFAKPWFAAHPGGPEDDLPGLFAYEVPGLLGMLVGLVCLGIAVFRARRLPWWVGVTFLASPVLGILSLPGGAGLIADYVLFAGLCAVGVHELRRGDDQETVATPLELSHT